MDIRYPIENEYMKCVLQINGFSGPHPLVRSSCRVGGGGGKARHVWGRSCGPGCDCLWLASRPLYDLFESVTA